MRRALSVLLCCFIFGGPMGCKSKGTKANMDMAAGEAPVADVLIGDSTSDRGGGDLKADVTDAPNGADAATLADRAMCQGVCDATATLPCFDPSSDCLAGCLRSLADPVCSPEARALHVCRFTAGPSAYGCMGGMVVLVSSICQGEAEALRACRRKDAGL